ncbi:MAG: hypothetical protein HYV07_09570 [Deltaproteobacteria bacterium]|nr:hypothetical protein [Deltaproteobacteria bacterium]
MKPRSLAPFILAPLVLACPAKEPPKKVAPDTRFLQTIDVLKRPSDPVRDAQLVQILQPVCGADAKERESFVEDMRAAVQGGRALHADALGVIEHTALRCKSKESGIDLLKRSRAVLGNIPRLDLATARLAAGAGDLPTALAAAEAAKNAGVISAIALLAQIKGEEARNKSAAWVPGMLDDAINTATVSETLVSDPADLLAMLSVRAHLLAEKATSESGELSTKARAEAMAIFMRLSQKPFPDTIRERSLDYDCYHGGPSHPACARAAAEFKVLGAAKAVGASMETGFDLERLRKLEKLASAPIEKGKSVLLVIRGTEGDLIHWTEPLAAILGKLGAKVIVSDGAEGPRAKALVARSLELAKVKPADTFDVVAAGPQAVSCLASLLNSKAKPAGCPFDDATTKRIAKLGKSGLALLVGKDLDADLQDIKTAEIPTAMLSFRETSVASGPDSWLKSLSDTFFLK